MNAKCIGDLLSSAECIIDCIIACAEPVVEAKLLDVIMISVVIGLGAKHLNIVIPAGDGGFRFGL